VKRRGSLWLSILGLFGALPAVAAAATPADYGDAPDGAHAGYLSKPHVTGHFPSKLTSNGAHHTAPGSLRLGEQVDPESDSHQVNLDTYDDGVTAALQPCRESVVSFVVNAINVPASMRTRGHSAYLNAWFDWNQDGRWKGASSCGRKAVPEWRVRNYPVDMASFATNPVQIIRVPVVAGPEVLDIWMRGSLTLDQRFTSPLGKGAFTNGETEDYLYHGPQPRPGDGKTKKKKGVVDEPPRHLIPLCFPDFIPHGKLATVSIFFWDPNIGFFWFPEPGTTLTLLNGTAAPAVPVDVNAQTFQFGATVKSLLIDDRANPFELVQLSFHITGPHITGFDQFLTCNVLIVHSWHIGGGGNPNTPGTPGGGQPGTVGQPPVASFTWQPNSAPTAPKVGQTVTFDASASSDPDGTIASYDWDFGNGAHGTGKFPGTQYLAPGKYAVTLTVTDNDGNKNATMQYVYVSGSGSKQATLNDVPCDSAIATGGYVDINIPSYAQNPTASLTSALSGCTGRSITHVVVTFVEGPVPPESGGSTTDEWGKPKNHLHVTFDLSGTSSAGSGSATFTANWQ
jgi:hypothetical protein